MFCSQTCQTKQTQSAKDTSKLLMVTNTLGHSFYLCKVSALVSTSRFLAGAGGSKSWSTVEATIATSI